MHALVAHGVESRHTTSATATSERFWPAPHTTHALRQPCRCRAALLLLSAFRGHSSLAPVPTSACPRPKEQPARSAPGSLRHTWVSSKNGEDGNIQSFKPPARRVWRSLPAWPLTAPMCGGSLRATRTALYIAFSVLGRCCATPQVRMLPAPRRICQLGDVEFHSPRLRCCPACRLPWHTDQDD